MKLIKIGLASPDQTVGAIDSNTEKLVAMAQEMAANDCTLGCFPEQSIPGYPVEDLVLWGSFLDRQWNGLMNFAEATKSLKTVFVVGLAVQFNSIGYNVAAVVARGTVIGLVPKEKLPTYGVFYEKRTYSAGVPCTLGYHKGVPFGDMIFDMPFGPLAVEVCEDIWSPDGPMRRRAYSGAEIVVNISASPFRSGVLQTRREMISTRASDNLVTVAYVNQYGGNDGLVFDGGGFVNQCGRMLLEAPRWKENIAYATADLDRTSQKRRENTTWRSDHETFLRDNEEAVRIVPWESDDDPQVNLPSYRYPVPENLSFFIPVERPAVSLQHAYFNDLFEAMVTGLDGYFRKTKAFKRIGVAMSGGKDSALTLLIAYHYATNRLGKSGKELVDFIQCFSLPTKFNSEETREIARDMCESLGVGFKEVPIADEVEQATLGAKAMLPPGEELGRLALQNIQARVRGKRMWDWANSTGGMWLQTGNMSEKAVGYTTIGGDSMGAYSLIGNLPKTVVKAMLHYLYETSFRLPALWQLNKSVESAELSEDQADERDLMPFPVLDACFALFAGEKMSPEEVLFVLREMFPDKEDKQLEEWVGKFINLFHNSIFKWVQMPETVHVGSLDLDRERALQLPVVQSREWLKSK